MDEVQGGTENAAERRGDERRGDERRSDERRAAEADAARPLQVRWGKVVREQEGSRSSRADPQGRSPGQRVARDRRRNVRLRQTGLHTALVFSFVLIVILVMQAIIGN